MDVTEANFNEAVIERSRQVPVVVDFWATWCGPCRQLGPALEQAIAARAPKIELAKVDTDANPRLAQAFRIQSIPAVKAIVDGRIHSEFLGAVPPPQIEAFLDALLPAEAVPTVDPLDEAALRAAVEADPHRHEAVLPLARLLLARGDTEEARTLLAAAERSFAAAGLLTRLDLDDRIQRGEDLPPLGPAFAALDQGDAATGLDLLLMALPAAGEARDDLRKVIIGVLEELGPEHELARSSRRRLASALY